MLGTYGRVFQAGETVKVIALPHLQWKLQKVSEGLVQGPYDGVLIWHNINCGCIVCPTSTICGLGRRNGVPLHIGEHVYFTDDNFNRQNGIIVDNRCYRIAIAGVIYNLPSSCLLRTEDQNSLEKGMTTLALEEGTGRIITEGTLIRLRRAIGHYGQGPQRTTSPGMVGTVIEISEFAPNLLSVRLLGSTEGSEPVNIYAHTRDVEIIGAEEEAYLIKHGLTIEKKPPLPQGKRQWSPANPFSRIPTPAQAPAAVPPTAVAIPTTLRGPGNNYSSLLGQWLKSCMDETEKDADIIDAEPMVCPWPEMTRYQVRQKGGLNNIAEFDIATGKVKLLLSPL